MKKIYKLPKKFAIKWIKALKSEKYKQTVGMLSSKNGYCCLGVACVVNGIPKNRINMCNLIHEEWMSKEDVLKMPIQLQGKIETGSLIEELTSMNDGGYSFESIANWIEKNVELI